jgi:hypothetical protein
MRGNNLLTCGNYRCIDLLSELLMNLYRRFLWKPWRRDWLWEKHLSTHHRMVEYLVKIARIVADNTHPILVPNLSTKHLLPFSVRRGLDIETLSLLNLPVLYLLAFHFVLVPHLLPHRSFPRLPMVVAALDLILITTTCSNICVIGKPHFLSSMEMVLETQTPSKLESSVYFPADFLLSWMPTPLHIERHTLEILKPLNIR